MTPLEAKNLLLFIDTVGTVLKLSKKLIAEARAEGLISDEEQEQRWNKVEKLLEGTEDAD